MKVCRIRDRRTIEEAKPSTVSDPSHDRYGQHLSEHDVAKLVQPSEDALTAVHEWLEDHAVETTQLKYTAAKDWIITSLPISKIEKMLDTKYSSYKHEDGSIIVRAPEWSLPTHLHKHIDTIQPTNSFFRATPKISTLETVSKPSNGFQPQYYSNPNVSAVCNTSGVTPLCLRTLYGTLDYTPQAAGVNKVGLTDYLGESNNRSDIHIFLEQFRPEAAGAAYDFKFDVIAGGADYQTLNATQLAAGTDREGNIDAETILAIDYPTPLIACTTGGSPPFIPDALTPTDTN